MGHELAPEISGWISSGYGYGLMFVAMLIEGPVITAAGAFAAVLGYFNIWTVFTLSVLGNLIPDALYYGIGFWGRHRFVEKYGKYMKLSQEKLERLERLYHTHAGKTIFAVKLLPLIATPGLIIAGVAKVPVKKFAFWSLIVTLPSSIGFLLLGYYFGAAYKTIVEYIDYGGYILLVAAIVIVIASYLYKKAAKKISKTVENI